ncbi:hypothetical protein LZD49_01905 [Dyadobacter sp. CY261]|uniref:hypothetical protein n=1 Tax=Dyadobacter sp. CY261 TaxID=2907203 RepID=UPI001F2CED36|nr:hypothetical protein [Dyadobacter sp. CY261]MCF0069207.1 hypothetical protein [Dyadobacter sp. CY261]
MIHTVHHLAERDEHLIVATPWTITDIFVCEPNAPVRPGHRHYLEAFTTAIKPDEASARIHLTGNKELAGTTLNLIAVSPGCIYPKANTNF